MENDIVESVTAFLSWINSLQLNAESLSSLQELKDGVILMKLLNRLYEFKI